MWNQKIEKGWSDGKRMKRHLMWVSGFWNAWKTQQKANPSWLVLAYMNCVMACLAKRFTRSSQLTSTQLWASLSHIISKPFDGLHEVVLESMSQLRSRVKKSMLASYTQCLWFIFLWCFYVVTSPPPQLSSYHFIALDISPLLLRSHSPSRRFTVVWIKLYIILLLSIWHVFTFFLRNLSHGRQKEAKPLACLGPVLHCMDWKGSTQEEAHTEDSISFSLSWRSILLILAAFYIKKDTLVW